MVVKGLVVSGGGVSYGSSLRRLSVEWILWTLVLVVFTRFGVRWTVLGAVRQNDGVGGIDG